ncbi:MAG: alpha/beta hydrolase-fold protein [Bacteroidales bacterium]|nr:alpha/beta hydrolase-fold protein [Bacteroidales bacterium]
MKTKSIVSLALCLLLVPVTLFAQISRNQSVSSPQVRPGGEVTFRLKAPYAKNVEISAQFLKGNQPLQKDSNGVWSITLGPVKPDIYPYNFIVDGTSVSDPTNTYLFPNENFKASLVEIPAEQPLLSSMQNVEHGKVTYCYYPSETLKCTRPLVIYTPPGYDGDNTKYPVLYLVSGTTDTEETWFKVGRANLILDNLIAQKKAVPMIIVMPYGNMLTGTPAPSTLQAADMYKVFSNDMTKSIIPYVEKNFRAIPDRESRAIAGFSRGGGQSLFTGFIHLDQFAWIGSYSAYLTNEVWDKYFSALSAKPEETNKKLRLLWMGVGNEDFLYKDAVKFIDLMKEKNINYKSLITDGGHTWMNSRHYLSETMQLYFKK